MEENLTKISFENAGCNLCHFFHDEQTNRNGSNMHRIKFSYINSYFTSSSANPYLFYTFHEIVH